jgi:hypothetical protein
VLTESPTPTSTTPGTTLHDEEPLIELRAVVDETLLAYADVIKAEAALSALEQIAGRLARADITRNGFQLARWLQDQIEELRTAPEFQSLHEEQLARAIRKGIPPFDDVNIRNEVALLLMRAPPPARLGLPLNTDLIDLQRVIANRILRWRRAPSFCRDVGFIRG